MAKQSIEILAIKEFLDEDLTELLIGLDKIKNDPFWEKHEKNIGVQTDITVHYLSEQEQVASDQTEFPQLKVAGETILQGKSFTIENVAGILEVGISIQRKPD